MTRIIQCTCQHEFQDELYGKRNRVFNETVSGDKVTGYRCTVCKKEVK